MSGEILMLAGDAPGSRVEGWLRHLGLDGPVCTITAGRQEWEGEIEGLTPARARRVIDLALYRRVESLFEADPALRRAHAERQRRIRALQALYRARLEHTARAARQVLRADGDDEATSIHRREALAAVRNLDRAHLRHLRDAREPFRAELESGAHARIVEERARVAAVLAPIRAVVVDGGHVAVLLNRLQLLGLAPLLAERTVIAWGAGAMAATERVVLFHDQLEEGPREPELLGEGLGLARRLVALPRARERLELGAPERTGLLARRFSPARCAFLDDDGHLLWHSAAVRDVQGAFRLAPGGRILRLRAQ